MIFVNPKWFDGLTADQKQLLKGAAAQVNQSSASRMRTEAAAGSNVVCQRGLTISTASAQALADLRAAVQPVFDELDRDPATAAAIAISTLRGSFVTPDNVAPCSAPVAKASPGGAPTPLDWKWTASFTKADLVASPLLYDNGEINDGNWGDMTITFDKGRYTGTQHNALTSSSTSGTFTVAGDTLTMSLDEGSNVGETFAFRWSIFRNTLTFKRDDALGAGPTPMLIKPWTKAP